MPPCRGRGEARGVGGIFFDDLDDKPMDELFAFISTMAMKFTPAYCPLVAKHKVRGSTPQVRAQAGTGEIFFSPRFVVLQLWPLLLLG
jgi:coproporphyrinogen III oxidase